MAKTKLDKPADKALATQNKFNKNKDLKVGTNQKQSKILASNKKTQKKYSHIEQWPAILTNYKQDLSAENYDKIVKIILASHWKNGTLYILISDPESAKWFKDNYLDHLRFYSFADDIFIKILQ